MNHELLIGLVVFSFVSSITPGPNNLMLMASGTNFGFKRTIPHMLGIGIGCIVMILIVGLGLARIFDAFPASYTVMKFMSVGYLVFLAWKIATAASPVPNSEKSDNGGSRPDKPAGKPFTFLQAALFQWVNPKAWAMALTVISVYAPGQTFGAVALATGVFYVINLPCISTWALLGEQLKRVLTNPRRLRVFNIIMAVLLLASMWPVLFAGGH